MQMPKVSVILPVYNKSPFLRRCLDSLANQTNKDFELIIIDDCSNDGSSMVCDEYAEKYGWKVFHKHKNGGVSAARNMGLDKAKGKYIAFIDGDDAFTQDAIEVMVEMMGLKKNIIQFGQYRHLAIYPRPVERCWPEGQYDLESLRRYWAMVWNKMYKASFLKSCRIRFIEGMQFGEDELFNANCMIANGGLYHSSKILVHHYFDDGDSLCRGGLCLQRLTIMDNAECELLERLKECGNEKGAKWIESVIYRHRDSDLFKQYGFARKRSGKYDVVYMVKDSPVNEELRYSLRSLEENWQYRDVWFCGGCPKGIRPDHHMNIEQVGFSKWERVRNMLRMLCENNSITENFWLFNDDFFILRLTPETMVPQYNGSLEDQINRVESRHGGFMIDYTKRLRHLLKTLDSAGKSHLNYSVHKPMLINRKKALEVLGKFPDEPMFRALYGNYWEIGGESQSDNKIALINYDLTRMINNNWRFVSTDDDSFANGTIGRWIRDRFKGPSRFE